MMLSETSAAAISSVFETLEITPCHAHSPDFLPAPFRTDLPDIPSRFPSYFPNFSRYHSFSSVKNNTISPAPAEKRNPCIGLADVFRLYGVAHPRKHSATPEQREVIRAIVNCRSGFYGYHIDVCDDCGHTETGMNSCRNRHCPQCQGQKRIEWADARMADVLPVPYYHVVATLPDAIYPVCLFNRKLVYDLLFDCFSETLKQFGRDPRWLGAAIGFFMVLHTWGQLMNCHPHVHVIVPAGGLTEDGEWVFPKYKKNNFLFPVHALSKVFRGKFIAVLKAACRNGEMNFPGETAYLKDSEQFEQWLNRLVSHPWVVYSKPPFGSPETVIGYVSRYTHRVAISNSRILSADNNGVIRFSFKNYKAKDRADLWQETELPADEFIRRFLFHVLPPRFHRIRHYGFLGNGQKSVRNRIRESLTAEQPETKPDRVIGTICPVCKIGVMMTVVVVNGRDMLIKGSFSELNRRISSGRSPLEYADSS